MKTYISLLLIILVLIVTQPNTGQCASHEVDLLQKIHCSLEKANINLEMNQDDVRCRRSGHDWVCYKFVTTKLNWSPARQVCNATGSDLVSIESADERDFLASALTDLHRGCDLFHTSGRHYYTTWKWMATWKPIKFEGWAAGEPSGNGHYLYVWNERHPSWGTWDDSVDQKECFICEHHIKLPSYC